MARHDDALIEQAAKRLATVHPDRDGPGAPGFAINTPTGDAPPVEPRLHKVPGRVTKDELKIIQRAVCRYLANLASVEDESDELTGRSIAAISRAWLKAQASVQSREGGT